MFLFSISLNFAKWEDFAAKGARVLIDYPQIIGLYFTELSFHPWEAKQTLFHYEDCRIAHFKTSSINFDNKLLKLSNFYNKQKPKTLFDFFELASDKFSCLYVVVGSWR